MSEMGYATMEGGALVLHVSVKAAPQRVACQGCGMLCVPQEYHPHAACLMYKACGLESVVRRNLTAVLEHGWTAAIDAVEPGSTKKGSADQ